MPPNKPLEIPQNQRSIRPPNYLLRLLPQWSTPKWYNANLWRSVVRNQPLCILCRDTLISYLLGTPWQVKARDSNDTDLYRKEINYYTELFNTIDGMDFDVYLDLLCQDILDTPFGGAAEIGREGDRPDGATLWIQHLDSATLYPTNDPMYPVAQRIDGVAVPPVFFPRHAIDRAFMTPRPEWDRKGWGMAPPEKIFLAIEMLTRGDRYYANLLLDTPEAGVLDLGDMDRESAYEWLESFKTMFTGADPLKVPILYEHDTQAKFIPFGRSPNEMIYDSVTFKYAQVITGGYGLKVADIGLSQDQARTLAGVIRSERATNRTGIASLSTKTKGHFDRMLPPYLEFMWIEHDDETMIAKGRARLANAQAYAAFRKANLLKLEELRGQIAADGLLDVQIDPNDIAELQAEASAAAKAASPFGGGGRPPDMARKRVPPSKGGEGELTKTRLKAASTVLESALEEISDRATPVRVRRLVKAITREIFPSVKSTFEGLEFDDLPGWAEAMVTYSFGEGLSKRDPINKAMTKIKGKLDDHLNDDQWWSVSSGVDPDDLTQAQMNIYSSALDLAASVVTQALYEEGYISTPEPETEARVDDPKVIADLQKASGAILKSMDLSLKDTIKSLVVAAAYYAMSSPTAASSIVGSENAEVLLSDDAYMASVLGNVSESLKEAYRKRAAASAAKISRETSEKAFKLFFEKLGLRANHWSFDGDELVIDQTKLFTIVGKKKPTLWLGG